LVEKSFVSREINFNISGVIVTASEGVALALHHVSIGIELYLQE